MNNDFKPYVPAEKVTPELTITSIIMGAIIAVVFGAANAYLGLRVGMTVSASIPAAVISMGVIRVILKKDSILESNMVQTIGSAGESLAAGTIFTLPVLYLWAKEGVIGNPSLLTITLIALCGGLLGVLFMVPLRNALIVQEHGVLPYPEGTACAEVLLVGEEGGANASTVFIGMGLAAVFKLLTDGFKVAAGVVTAPVKALKTELSAEAYPALIGVGYICGIKISSFMFAGGIIGWFVLIPLIVLFGGDTMIYPGEDTIVNLYAAGGASLIWSRYIRYVGAGAVAAAGIISLIRTFPMIISSFIDAVKGMKSAGKEGSLRTEHDMNIKTIIVGIAVIAIIIAILPQIPVNLLGAILIVIFGFFFGAVSSRMVGLVGSSNNPVSGMAIATLLFVTACFKLVGNSGSAGMEAAIAVGSIVCIVACMAGDTSQDLKTGYILGATPIKQQIGEIIGTVVSALAIGGVLMLLDKAWGFGSEAIPAPQASLMKLIVEGVMSENLPWPLIFVGVFIAIVVELLGINALAVAIGLYLPLELTSTIMMGGVLRHVLDKKNKNNESESSAGVLYCSGMIAGEGIVGILLAILTVAGLDSVIDLSNVINLGTVGGIILLILMIASVVYFAQRKPKTK